MSRQVRKEDMYLYAVTDRSRLNGKALEQAVREACEGGITFLQIREKHLDREAFEAEARRLQAIAKEYHIPFVVNDDVELAKKIDADGVHIGQGDMELVRARKILGPDKIIGVSAHNAREAIQAEENGADYLGSGAVFGTSTKGDASVITKETFCEVTASVSIPVVAIGGIGLHNIEQLKEYHANGVAVSSAVFGAEDITGDCRKLLEISREIF